MRRSFICARMSASKKLARKEKNLAGTLHDFIARRHDKPEISLYDLMLHVGQYVRENDYDDREMRSLCNAAMAQMQEPVAMKFLEKILQ